MTIPIAVERTHRIDIVRGRNAVPDAERLFDRGSEAQQSRTAASGRLRRVSIDDAGVLIHISSFKQGVALQAEQIAGKQKFKTSLVIQEFVIINDFTAACREAGFTLRGGIYAIEAVA